MMMMMMMMMMMIGVVINDSDDTEHRGSLRFSAVTIAALFALAV